MVWKRQDPCLFLKDAEKVSQKLFVGRETEESGGSGVRKILSFS
jgi:hypothetical protein